jgi:hypothetical protein
MGLEESIVCGYGARYTGYLYSPILYTYTVLGFTLYWISIQYFKV